MADDVDIALRRTSRQSLLHLYRFHRNVIPRYSPYDTGQAIYWRRGERLCTPFETIVDRSKTYGKVFFLPMG